MMFLESPWPILLIGIVAEAAMGARLAAVRARQMAVGHAGVGVVVIGGLLAEHFVVTDRKLIAQTLDTAAAAVRPTICPACWTASRRTPKSPGPTRSDSSGRFVFKTGTSFALDIKINRLYQPADGQGPLPALRRGRGSPGY